MMIRPARADDRAALLALLQPVIARGETYALDRDMSAEAILDYWLGAEKDTFVAEADGVVLGTYYLRANQAGGGRHVANCGYVTSGEATGRGVARAMCRHSLDHARARGFRAMQFNCVVSTNTRAVALWQAMGFEIVGRLPGAFEHPEQGPVDAFVMFQTL
ncbi:GNAT family N-acetyltransferase [Aureimonas sp. N4]|uniref:GNAT family N-acetyltransferase n=1 Tax=Aureimonas sp. N4 TaxID=1638165 RepID=UPI0007820FA6|nr:GNAT family N-acetyltransferase [Aureimonas sp. N4]